MNPSIIAACCASSVCLLMIILIVKSNNEKLWARRIKSRKTEQEKIAMKELAKKYIDKKCVLYTFNGSQYVGFIKEVTDGALLIDNKGSKETINLDFVVRIKEVPKNKKGEYKSTFA